MADTVLPWGSKAAKLVLIGEAPGRWEHVYGQPFVGPSYHDKLKPWWDAAGLKREQFYITNVLDAQPGAIDRVPESEMRAAFDALHDRLAALGDPWLIVPTGNYALYALTGKGKVSFHTRDGRWERPGIQSWRGSILWYEDRRGRKIKVIPTVHPAATFRTPELSWVCERDWKRIADDAQFRELRLPERTHLIAPLLSDVIEYARWTRSEAAKRGRLACSLDVETPKHFEYEIRQKESTAATAKCAGCGHTRRWHLALVAPAADSLAELDVEAISCSKKAPKKAGGAVCECTAFVAPKSTPKQVKINEYPYLGCIGYAWQPKLSLCVPTTRAYWKEPGEYERVMQVLRELHADPHIDWVGQNFLFDAWWCAEEGVPVSTMRWDTMKLHRVRAPWSAWHDLAFQASLYTRQPRWKDEAKDPDSIVKYAHNNEALWTYNGIDNCVQIELAQQHVAVLHELGRLEYYDELEAPIDPVLLQLSRTGLRTNVAAMTAERTCMLSDAAALAKDIDATAGRSLMGKAKAGQPNAVSNKKLIAYLYGADGLRLPEQYTTVKIGREKKKRVTVNIVAVKRLMERFPGYAALQAVGTKVLRHRRLLKVASFLQPARLVGDRWLAMFKQDTVLGRLSSSATPKGDGSNLQNIDRTVRQFFLPEETLDEAPRPR